MRQLLNEFISGILGQHIDAGLLLTPEERRMIFYHLSREKEISKLYAVGERLVWTAKDLDDEALKNLSIPHIDEFVINLRSRFAPSAPLRKTCWPQNHPFALCLSHDMDHVTSYISRERWRQFYRIIKAGYEIENINWRLEEAVC
jgi:hypothetical protein